MLNIADLFLFEQVVKYGSFTKAAPYAYMTPPALTHRITELEKTLAVQLFERTSQGVSLTPAGSRLHQQAPKLIQGSQHLIQDVQATQQRKKIIRIGTSTINPASALNWLWNQLLAALPDYQIIFVPLETYDLLYPNFYDHLGEDIDLVFNPSGFSTTSQKATFIKLREEQFEIALKVNDPLAQKDTVHLADLADHQLLIPQQGLSETVDQVITEIKQRQPDMKLVDTDIHYSIATFNNFIENGQYLLSLPCWDNIFPGITNRPIDLQTTIDYGIMAPKQPSGPVATFISQLKTALK